MYKIVRNMLLTSTSAICCFLGCLKLNLCFQGLASGRSASPTASGSLQANYSHLFSARKSENLHRYCQWWARAINSSLYFRALIIFKANKGLIVIGTIYYNGAHISFMYRRPTLYPLEIAVDFLKSP